jgi:hypothetical protein
LAKWLVHDGDDLRAVGRADQDRKSAAVRFLPDRLLAGLLRLLTVFLGRSVSGTVAQDGCIISNAKKTPDSVTQAPEVENARKPVP